MATRRNGGPDPSSRVPAVHLKWDHIDFGTLSFQLRLYTFADQNRRQRTLAAAISALFQSVRLSETDGQWPDSNMLGRFTLDRSNSKLRADTPYSEGRYLKVLDTVKSADNVAVSLAKKNLSVFHSAKSGGIKAWLDTWTNTQNSTHGSAAPPSILVVSRMISLLDGKQVGLPEDTRLLHSEALVGLSRMLRTYSGNEVGKVMQDLKLQLEIQLTDEPAQAVRHNLSSAMELMTKA